LKHVVKELQQLNSCLNHLLSSLSFTHSVWF